MAEDDLSRAEVERLQRLHYGGQADAMLAEGELTHRMWTRYQRMATFDVNGRVAVGPNVHECMAALADEVRQYDREQAAKVRADQHGIGMVHRPDEGCGICNLRRADSTGPS